MLRAVFFNHQAYCFVTFTSDLYIETVFGNNFHFLLFSLMVAALDMHGSVWIDAKYNKLNLPINLTS